MAGICLGSDMQELLLEHDRIMQPFSFESEKLVLLSREGETKLFIRARRNVTSWDSLYYRLRSNFDGYASDYYPTSPESRTQDGVAEYTSKTKCIDLQTNRSSAVVQVTIEDQVTKTNRCYDADIVIAADGPSSLLRKKYLPNCVEKYVGYVVWRGVVPEARISSSTRDLLQRNITVFKEKRHHCLAYFIPGDNGSISQGDRYVNFAWYTNENESRLAQIMIDSNTGYRHRKTVPAGRIRPEMWKKMLDLGHQVPLPPSLLEVLRQIEQPFVQAITELHAPQMVFEEKRLFLIGDCASTLRPHTAFSATQAAFHVLALDSMLKNRLSVAEWNSIVVKFGNLHGAQSRWLGVFYQSGYISAVLAVFHYWYLAFIDIVTAVVSGKRRLLRTT